MCRVIEDNTSSITFSSAQQIGSGHCSIQSESHLGSAIAWKAHCRASGSRSRWSTNARSSPRITASSATAKPSTVAARSRSVHASPGLSPNVGARQLLSSPAWPEKVNGGIPESLVVCLRSGGLDNRVRREGDHPWMGNWLNFMQN